VRRLAKRAWCRSRQSLLTHRRKSDQAKPGRVEANPDPSRNHCGRTWYDPRESWVMGDGDAFDTYIYQLDVIYKMGIPTVIEPGALKVHPVPAPASWSPVIKSNRKQAKPVPRRALSRRFLEGVIAFKPRVSFKEIPRGIRYERMGAWARPILDRSPHIVSVPLWRQRRYREPSEKDLRRFVPEGHRDWRGCAPLLKYLAGLPCSHLVTIWGCRYSQFLRTPPSIWPRQARRIGKGLRRRTKFDTDHYSRPPSITRRDQDILVKTAKHPGSKIILPLGVRANSR
jgi:hypothetical protein